MSDMKQDIGSDSTGAQIANANTVNIGVNPAPVDGIPKYLTLRPAKNPNFVGRETELKRIKEDLADNGMVYIVNGIGGIGKSELAYKYLLDNEDKYQHIALFEFSETSDTLEDILINTLKQNLFLDDEIKLDDILYRLQNLPEKCLLVFDNLTNVEDIEKLTPLNINCDVLITTRLNISTYKCLNLEILPPDDARALFQQHYTTKENIDDILEYIDYHSLFIELTAKTLQESCLSLQELREKFQNGEFTKIDRDFENSFNDFLIQRFQIEGNEDLRKQLQLLALLPSIEIQTTTLEEIFNKDKRLKPKLSELAKRGWLIQKEGSYKLHQIIKEFILANHPVDFDTASPTIQSICQQLDPNNAYLNPNEKTYFIEIVESILERFSKEENAVTASLQDSLCCLYNALGRYSKALKVQKTAVVVKEDVLGDQHPDTADSYSYISVIYHNLGIYPKALEFAKKAIDIREKNLGYKHPNTAKSNNDIAVIYRAQRKYSKALEFHQKALDIREEVLSNKHPDIATSYNNIAGIYNIQGKYPEALEFHKKALEIEEEVLGNKHPSTAISYNNIALVYSNQEKHSEALEFYEKALSIQEEVVGDKHPHTATFYHNISYAYLRQKKCKKALEYASKALPIFQRTNHYSNILEVKNLIKLITRNIKKAKNAPLKRRAKFCKDRSL